MKVRVFLTDENWHQFCGRDPIYNKVREVTIPPEEIKDLIIQENDYLVDGILELAFKYGQNDFQTVEPGRRSVSVGDVVWLMDSGDYYKVEGIGWKEIQKSEIVVEIKDEYEV